MMEVLSNHQDGGLVLTTMADRIKTGGRRAAARPSVTVVTTKVKLKLHLNHDAEHAISAQPLNQKRRSPTSDRIQHAKPVKRKCPSSVKSHVIYNAPALSNMRPDDCSVISDQRNLSHDDLEIQLPAERPMQRLEIKSSEPLPSSNKAGVKTQTTVQDAGEAIPSRELEQKFGSFDSDAFNVLPSKPADASNCRHVASTTPKSEVVATNLVPASGGDSRIALSPQSSVVEGLDAIQKNRHPVDKELPFPQSIINSSLDVKHVSADIKFVEDTKEYLRYRSNITPWNTGVSQACRIGYILENAQPANDTEALFIRSRDATEIFRANSHRMCPIFVSDQQHLPLQTPEQFLDELYDDGAKVCIQDPTVKPSKKQSAVRPVSIKELKDRFAMQTPGEEAWNCLELATHVEDGLRPDFLNDEDCRLLTKLKHPFDADRVSRHSYQPGWKEVEKWALLAQAGAVTEPHQDSHGFSTYITVNHGVLGFGWLSNPTPEERRSWNQSPEIFVGGRWRYVVLRPGQTVYFPGGTVHFVFRLPAAGNTLAFGGHILRCSQIVHWVTTMIDEKKNPNISNEELSVSAPAYLERVEKFVTLALQNGSVDRWGGRDACNEFLRLKAEFMKTKKAR